MAFKDFVLIFCNGEPPSAERIKNLLPHPKIIACADGGANKAISLGYKPDLVVGDLDSLDFAGADLKDVEIVKIDSQDDTDLEKTLRVLLDRGFREFLVIAFSGGRIDQTLANLQIAYEQSKKCRIVLADNQYLVFPAPGNFESDVPRAADISIIPMEDGTNVSTTGLAYELHQASLRKGGQGISNRSEGNKIEITVHTGGVMVFVRDI
jgi:thiamine pyrophosphokinase